MQDLRAAASHLARVAQSPLPFRPDFIPLVAPARDVSSVVAVDGSAALLADNGAVWVAAVCAEALRWPGMGGAPPRQRVVAATSREADALVEADYAAAGFDAPRVAGAESWSQALQGLAEWQAAADVIAGVVHAGGARAPEEPARTGDSSTDPRGLPSLILIDGALRGLPRHAQAMADALADRARTAGIPLIGVAKRSALGDALVPKLAAAGPATPWVVEVAGEPGVHVARLHRAATHAFRVDADSREAIAALMWMCRDASYLGYPYPLALVHNRVAFTGGRVAELKAQLERELRGQGASTVGLASDFHDVLDRNVPG